MGLGSYRKRQPWRLGNLCRWLAPVLDVTITVNENGDESFAVKASDWRTIEPMSLVERVHLFRDDWAHLSESEPLRRVASQIQPVTDDDGQLIGRAALVDPMLDRELSEHSLPAAAEEFTPVGIVTAGGFRASENMNFCGILLGRSTEAARFQSEPVVVTKPELLSDWASSQAKLISKVIDDPMLQSHYALKVQGTGGCPGPLVAFRYQDQLLSYDDLVAKRDWPKEVELVQDMWPTELPRLRGLTDRQLGVATDKMRTATPLQLKTDPLRRSEHRFWRVFWPSLWAAAIEALANAWGVSIDDVLDVSDLNYEETVPLDGTDGNECRFTIDVIRCP
jgi:hypothetical protein